MRVRTLVFGLTQLALTLGYLPQASAQVQVTQDIELGLSGYDNFWLTHVGEGSTDVVTLWGSVGQGSFSSGCFAAFDTTTGQFVWNVVMDDSIEYGEHGMCLDVKTTDSAYIAQWTNYVPQDSTRSTLDITYFSIDGADSGTITLALPLGQAGFGMIRGERAYLAFVNSYHSSPHRMVVGAFDLEDLSPIWEADLLPDMPDCFHSLMSARWTAQHGIVVTALSAPPNGDVTLTRAIHENGQLGYLQYFASPDSLWIYDALETASSDLWTVGLTVHPPQRLMIHSAADGSFVFLPMYAEDGQCELNAVHAPISGGLLISLTHFATGISNALIRVDEQRNIVWSAEQVGGWSSHISGLTEHSGGGYLAVAYDEYDLEYHVMHLVETSDGADKAMLPPSSFILSAYPNPFNAVTTLTFSLPQEGKVELRVYDVTGRLVKTLVDELMSAGEHQTIFDAGGLPSGLYFAQLRSREVQATQKIMLLK